MDLWEANGVTTGLTPHVCNVTSLYECTGDECAFDGVCDKWGCGYNPYANGNPKFYGPGYKVDTKRPFTVVTQFPAKKGVLTEIRRLYIQDGKVIHNAAINMTGNALNGNNSITDTYCEAQGAGAARFMAQGAMEGMGEALSRGMVLIFSIWWDSGGFMNWLDSGSSGPCNATEGDPAVIVKVQPDPTVTWSNIKWGEIGSTYSTRKGHY
jgi:cellulase